MRLIGEYKQQLKAIRMALKPLAKEIELLMDDIESEIDDCYNDHGDELEEIPQTKSQARRAESLNQLLWLADDIRL
jgi:hypothetical protein